MSQKGAILIDEFPAGSKLYFCADGSVVIASGTDSESRRLYTIKPRCNFKSRSCLVQKWSRVEHQWIDVGSDDAPHKISEDDKALPILRALFSSLTDSTLEQLEEMEDELAWELAAYLEENPRIQAAGYPISYIALILWQENGKEITKDIENTGGKIKTEHLCQALGVNRLTRSMKQFIRTFKPQLCKQTHIKLARLVLQQWHIFKPIVCGRNGALDTWQMNAICECVDQYPALSNSKWFHLGDKDIEDALWLYCPEEIQATYHFYRDNLAEKGKPIPAEASNLDRFLTCHIRSSKQLNKLYWQAQEYLTERSENWLKETYPDDYPFGDLPTIADSEKFRLLRTAGQLREVAAKLQNCAAGYLHEAVTGKIVFLAYEHSPDNSLHLLPHNPNHPVNGLLALRRDTLDQWLQSGTPLDWDWDVIRHKLIAEFKGYRNEELGERAWLDLESFLQLEIQGQSTRFNYFQK